MTEPGRPYSPAHRVRLCLACGATMDTPLEGGQLTCPNCSTVALVPPRSLEPLGTRSGAGSVDGAGVGDPVETPEQLQQRLAILRKQEQSYNPSNPYATEEAPDGYEQLVFLPSEAESLARLLVAYREAYERCASRPTAQLEHAIYWITWRMDNVFVHLGRSVHGYGIIQTSLDLLTNRRYQHLLRSMAGNKARKAGEYASAEAWLALCDPAPTILDLDTEYRTTLAILHLARGQSERALALVGTQSTDIPFEPASFVVMGAIRVAALEMLGRTAEAESAMRELQIQIASVGAEKVLALTLGPESVFAPARPAWARVKQADRGHDSLGKADEMLPPTRKLLIIAGLLGLLGAWTTHCGIDYVKTAQDRAAWKTTKGHIEKVRTSERRSGTKTSISVGVIYSYQVDGRFYRGTNVWPGQDWNNFSRSKDAQREINRLESNPDVTVHYNPQKPSEAALDKSTGGFMVQIVATWLSTAGFLLAVLLLIRAYRRRLRAHRKFMAGVGD